MTILKGIPDVPANTPLSAQLTYTRPYQQGQRLGIGTHTLNYDWGQSRWENADGSAFDLVAARFNQNDPAPTGEIRLLFKTGSGAGAQAGVLNTLPVETAAGELDITVPVGSVAFVSGPAMQALIASLTGLNTSLQTGLTALNAGLASIPAGLADIAQSAALASAAAGLIPTATLAAIPGAAGIYRIMTGADAGQVWERVGGTLTRRPELEAAAASRTARVWQVPIISTATAAQNAALFRAIVDAAAEYDTLQFPGGSGLYDLTSIGAILKSLTIDLNQTRIRATIATSATTGAPLFYFQGTVAATGHPLTACTEGSRTVTLATPADAASYAVGDWVRVQDNRAVPAWDNPDGTGAISTVGASGYTGRYQLTQIVSIAGAVLTVLHPLEWAYDTTPKLYRYTKLIERPRVLNGRVAEVDPGYAHTGVQYGVNSSHVVHFNACLRPEVAGMTFDGWNCHAINFTECVEPHEHNSIGRYPFRPTLGGQGYFSRLATCTGGLSEQSATWGVRHHVDWSHTYDGVSRNNVAYDIRGAAYFEHGLGEKRCRSQDDLAYGTDTASPGSQGWAVGNPYIAASFGMTITRPKYRGGGVALTVAAGSTDVVVTDPDIICPQPVIFKTGASNLTISGGRIEGTGTAPTIQCVPFNFEGGGTVPSNLTVTGAAQIVNSGGGNPINLNIGGDVRITAGVKLIGGDNQINLFAGTPRDVLLQGITHSGAHTRSVVIGVAPSRTLELSGNSYRDYTSYAVRLPNMALTYSGNRLYNADGSIRSDGLYLPDGKHPSAVFANNLPSASDRNMRAQFWGSESGPGLLTVNASVIEDASGNVAWRIDPAASATGTASVGIGRGVTAAALLWQMFKGDGTATVIHQLSAAGASWVAVGGRLGIGTASPDATVAAHVAGALRVDGTASLRGANRTINLYLSEGGTNNVDASFRVDPATGTAGNAFFGFARGTNTTGTVAMQVFKGDNTSTVNAVIAGNGTTYFAANNGNVGIGITGPTAKLHVVGSALFNGNLGFYNTTPIAKPTVTGSRGGNAALASLITALAALGLITDTTTV